MLVSWMVWGHLQALLACGLAAEAECSVNAAFSDPVWITL